jgi:hypothetical protein
MAIQHRIDNLGERYYEGLITAIVYHSSLLNEKMTLFTFVSFLSLYLCIVSVRVLVLIHTIKNMSCYSEFSRALFDHFPLRYFFSTFLRPTIFFS